MSDPRHLLLLRHAEAIPGGPGLDDFDRPLSPRGHAQAAAVARHLAKLPIAYVLCSASTRTRETAHPILKTRCTAMPTVVYDKRVYGADARGLITLLSAIPATAHCVLFVGHNPAIEDLLLILTPTQGSLPSGFPKGVCVHLTTTAPWSALVKQTTKVVAYYKGDPDSAEAGER